MINDEVWSPKIKNFLVQSFFWIFCTKVQWKFLILSVLKLTFQSSQCQAVLSLHQLKYLQKGKISVTKTVFLRARRKPEDLNLKKTQSEEDFFLILEDQDLLMSQLQGHFGPMEPVGPDLVYHISPRKVLILQDLNFSNL